MKAITIEEIKNAVGGELVCIQECTAKNIWIETIVTDSRKITSGCLFIPIRGENFDGHTFIQEAFSLGAVCALSEEEQDIYNEKVLIIVKDTRKALRDLAEYMVSLFQIPIVAVTGSVGKTTTKDMIASVLSQKYHVLKTEGNYNNEIGLPLTVFQLNQTHDVAVLEMGMNQFGEIHNLAKIARPDIAVITNIGVSHIENLGSKEGILKAKSEIFDFMDSQGIAVLNMDDDLLFSLLGRVPCYIQWYGIDSRAGIYADEIVPIGLNKIACSIHTNSGDFSVEIPIPGRHMVLNSLAATAVGLQLGIELELIKKGIESFVPTKMRMSIETTKSGIVIINDTYNANPVSMKASLDVLCQSEGKKTAIMGDMFELGEFAASMHKEVGMYAAEKGIDTIICIGTLSKSMAQGAKEAGGKKVYFFQTQEEFFNQGLSFITEGTVLVKASRAMHLEKTVERIQEVK